MQKALSRQAGKPLTLSDRRALEQTIEDIGRDTARDPGGHALACAEALRAGAKIEQEAFEPALDSGLELGFRRVSEEQHLPIAPPLTSRS